MKAVMDARWFRVAMFALVGALVGSGSFAAYRYTNASDDCCYEGSPCCQPGAPCCQRSGHRR
jgi:hypothetical protein